MKFSNIKFKLSSLFDASTKRNEIGYITIYIFVLFLKIITILFVATETVIDSCALEVETLKGRYGRSGDYINCVA